MISDPDKKAFEKLCSAKPVLKEIKQARDVLPFLDDYTLLHVSPPIEPERMCGPVRGAIECAIVYEEWTESYSDAWELVLDRKVKLEATHHHGFVGPVSAVVSPSMWVYCVKNETNGNWAYCPMLEHGKGRALRFGAQGDDVLQRLKHIEEVIGPVLSDTIKKVGRIDLQEIIRSSLEMGDECHNRHEAARLLFLNKLIPSLFGLSNDRHIIAEVFEYIAQNYYFFVNISMATCKAMSDSIKNVPGSAIVSAMARNGTDFGIRVAGLGDKWFAAPCNRIDGIFFDGYAEPDGNLDLGDSSITETVGLGAFAMAASPAISRYIGGSVQDLEKQTKEMYKITAGEHTVFKIPAFEYRGTPTGIDVRKVVETGITPIINTSISHREPGIGQIGAGRTMAPIECFEKALAELEKYSSKDK